MISKPSFQTKLSFAELGLPDIGEVAIPPTMKLIDKAKLQPFHELEQKIRNHLKQNSFEYFGGLRYITWDLFEGVNNRIQGMLSEWKSSVEFFAEDYSLNRTNALSVWKQKAEEIWNSSQPLQSRLSKDLYIDRVEKKIADHWPIEAELRSKFSIHINVAQFKAGINAQGVPAATLAAAQKQANEAVKDFIKQGMIELRKKTATLCIHVRDLMINNGQIQEKSLQPIRNWIDKFKTLNFFDDKECEKYLEDLKEFLGDSDAINADSEAMEAFGSVLDHASQLIEGVTSEVVDQHIQELSGRGGRRLLV